MAEEHPMPSGQRAAKGRVGRAITIMSNTAYARVAIGDDEAGVAVVSQQRRPRRLQWCCLFLLTAFATVVLAQKFAKKAATAPLAPAVIMVNGTAVPAPNGKRRGRGGRRWQYAMTMGRTGTSSSFVLRTPRRSIKKQAAKAATRSVVLIGSQFGAGNELLKRVFGELCQRTRLSLRCEATWGGQHDLKTLASFKSRRKRLVWLESDASSLLQTMRNLKQHAHNYQLVHLLWDPMQACTAQWPHTLGSNVSLASSCMRPGMDDVALLYVPRLSA